MITQPEKSVASMMARLLDKAIAREKHDLITLARKQCFGRKRIVDQCKTEVSREGSSHIVTFTTLEGHLFAKVWISRKHGYVQNVQHGLDAEQQT